MAGKRYYRAKKILRFKILGYIPEKDMAALHASALFLALSLGLWSFGLPLVKIYESWLSRF